MMGVAVLILGHSGSGKSTSLRGFDPEDIGVLNIKNKRLPFRNRIKTANLNNYATKERYECIRRVFEANKLNAYIVDDAGYLMQDENLERAKEKGFDKYVEMACHFISSVNQAKATNDDTIVYFMMHYDTDATDGHMRPKTIGRLLDEKYCIEGVFDVTLQSCVQDGKHVFVYKNDGYNATRGGMDMFPDVMDNDLKRVDDIIRDYWGLEPLHKQVEAHE